MQYRIRGLNEILDGDPYPGLTCLGSIPGSDKTTFALQIADTADKGEQDVLFFTLEMGEHELIVKSLSRLTYEISKDLSQACTMWRILDARSYNTYSPERADLIERAFTSYSETMIASEKVSRSTCRSKF